MWAGTDDGNVQLSRNGGVTWSDVREAIPGIPEKIWVSRIEASHHLEGRAYVVLDNHRYDDMRAYVFRTDDFGATWTDISANLPDTGGSYVLVEDPVSPRLLFVGTEFGVYASVTGGNSWDKLDNGLPTVAAYDLVIHPREADLVVGTHGRSIWILDDITPLRHLSGEIMGVDAWLMSPRRATDWVRINLGRKQPDFLFRGENPPPGALLHFWLGSEPGDVSLVVEELMGERRAEIRIDPHAGLNRALWNLRFPSSPRQRRSFVERQMRTLRTVEERAAKPELRARLEEIREQLAAVDLEGERADRDLNAVRGALVAEFAIYAGGESLFGPRIGATAAEPGTYRVVLQAGDTRREQALEVRADPLERED